MTTDLQMRSKQIERAAYRMDDPPEGWDLFDHALYHGLRLLYTEYRARAVTKEQAGREKQQLLELWTECKVRAGYLTT